MSQTDQANIEKPVESDQNEITETKMLELKEAFCLFDKEGEGQIGVSEMGTVLRACGYCPTEEQINSFILQKGSSENSEIKVEDGGKKESEQTIVDPTGTGKLSFDEFAAVCRQMPKPMDEKQELINAFGVFDKHNTGKLLVEDFKQIMTTMGEKLTDAEFDEMMKLTNVDEAGEFDYMDLVDTLVEGIR